jgi:hypothetical protein
LLHGIVYAKLIHRSGQVSTKCRYEPRGALAARDDHGHYNNGHWAHAGKWSADGRHDRNEQFDIIEVIE